ncbi:MAG: type II toxin-antitoxin system YafQ family toxin [Schwartzia succinivorans]|jgi:mRNA interferase YafQ|uniref:type II toxin-antitoxin system YafQ family toxin n=1 Tax=Schwartzia succinivorans TaxID=55507 RepID=UPI002357E0FC|nr:type II toxin-antitoxin system YafQ family toxin [Schwartzia succinivorans]MBE6097491.1 type II toxin-antitoxin system YafQ family toxin [Schwartzia succinivorans]
MLTIEYPSVFKKDYKRALKRGCNPKNLETVVKMLQRQQPLPEKYRDHALADSRNLKNVRECHIEPDWLLIYQIINDRLVLKLMRTGTHSDLF